MPYDKEMSRTEEIIGIDWPIFTKLKYAFIIFLTSRRILGTYSMWPIIVFLLGSNGVIEDIYTLFAW